MSKNECAVASYAQWRDCHFKWYLFKQICNPLVFGIRICNPLIYNKADVYS